MWEYVYSDELYHHGIKGMKWGVRRYQKEDGSLTSAGKKRYHKNESYRSKLAIKAKKKSERFQTQADKALMDVDDLKTNGTKSEAYKKWKKANDADLRRKREYDKKHGTNTYVMAFWDRLDSSEVINKLIDENTARYEYNVRAAETWLKANTNLMNMPITELTTRNEIRKQRQISN